MSAGERTELDLAAEAAGGESDDVGALRPLKVCDR